ncbi:hypothetical protein QW060_05775 [Myroides ceti]|uniref:Uncharacterized protein n=1 Tax=Paenimyroides ceti TaxID=395087 RepID=A0ABT8CQ73_9FLAO|nr:hypothetical protein [Paenimyroides ceti]MDN3706638.1 hypothetical protein [Paenimyroides ceti]
MYKQVVYKIIAVFFLIVYFHPNEETDIEKIVLYILLLVLLIVDILLTTIKSIKSKK